MQKDGIHEESLSPEIQDVLKSLIAAIRIVKIYPANNPIYSSSIKKSYEALSHFLKTEEDFQIGVQKTYFTHLQAPFGKDAQVNRAIAQDLFTKGVREVIFSREVTEGELQRFFEVLAFSAEELAMRSGISTILWEKGATCIKVTEAGLDDVITTKSSGGWETSPPPGPSSEKNADSKAKRDASFSGRTLVLGDVKADPAGFGAGMVEFAMRTRAEHESVEDRLFTLYQQAGRKIRKDHAQESEMLFEGLAESALALEPQYRDRLIGGKLFGDMDRELNAAQEGEDQNVIPNVLHELRTGRFSNAWTVQQVSALLKRSAAKKAVSSVPPPVISQMQAVPLSSDLPQMVQTLEETSAEELEALKVISHAGMESDIIEAAVRTLILLIPLVKSPYRKNSGEKELVLFSGVIRQLEDMLSYLLKNNKYDLATAITKALHMPVPPEFKPRMIDALKKTATRAIIVETITDMRKHARESPEYAAVYAYLVSLDQKATEALLDLLAEENDRETRIFLLDLMKDFGKNQISLLGEHLSDERWYVVRNIVSILAESKTDQAIILLRKAADHKNIQIRQEVIKALISIGGKKAAGVLAKFLRDQDPEIQLTAIHAFADFPGIGAQEAKPISEFLEDRPVNKKEQERTLAAIRTLGKVGGQEAAFSLHAYTRIRWWKSRTLQRERRDAALRSIEEITRREDDGGRAER